jgi:hypothetical protein
VPVAGRVEGDRLLVDHGGYLSIESLHAMRLIASFELLDFLANASALGHRS